MGWRERKKEAQQGSRGSYERQQDSVVASEAQVWVQSPLSRAAKVELTEFAEDTLWIEGNRGRKTND